MGMHEARPKHPRLLLAAGDAVDQDANNGPSHYGQIVVTAGWGKTLLIATKSLLFLTLCYYSRELLAPNASGQLLLDDGESDTLRQTLQSSV